MMKHLTGVPDMKAARLYGIRDIRIDDVTVPKPGPRQALVEIRSVGICGSDVHYYTHGRIGRYVVEPPFILGHECSGVVVEVGEGVEHIAPGDLVAVEPGVPCGHCAFCRSGKYNLCPDVVFLATPPYDGAFAEYIVHDADFLFRVPEGVTADEAAMCEPLSTGLQAVKRAELTLGETVFIAGMGPIGLANMQAFKAAGAGAIYVSDIDSARLETALKLGATEAFLATETDLVKELRKRTLGRGPDVVVEAAGSAEATKQTVEIVRPGGRVVLVGLAPEATVPINMLDVIDKEIDVRGVFRYANTYPAALALIAQSAVDMKSMVTAQYPLEKADEAMRDVADRKPGIIKAVVTN